MMMLRKGFRCYTPTFNKYIIARNLQVDTFQNPSQWLKYIEEKTEGPNLVKRMALNYLLKTCTTKDDVRNIAPQAFQIYSNKRIELNEQAAGLFFSACNRAQDPAAAVEVLKDASKRLHVWAGKRSVNNLLAKLDKQYPGKTQALDEMKAVLEAVKEGGFVPNSDTYFLLIRACCSRSDIELAQKYVEEAGDLLKSASKTLFQETVQRVEDEKAAAAAEEESIAENYTEKGVEDSNTDTNESKETK